MPGREHEAVAVEPVRVRRVVLHDPRVEHVRERRERHRGARMAGVRLLDRVHRERADRVDRELSSSVCVLVVIRFLLSIRCAAGSIACRPLSREQAGAYHPGVCPAAGERNVTRFHSAGSAREPASSTARSKYRSAARESPPPTRMYSGSKMFT